MWFLVYNLYDIFLAWIQFCRLVLYTNIMITNMSLPSDIQRFNQRNHFQVVPRGPARWCSGSRRLCAAYLAATGELHSEKNLGKVRDDEARWTAGPPAPIGGDDTKERIDELARMSRVFWLFQTSLTGIKNLFCTVLILYPPDIAMSRRPCDLLELQNQARVEGVPSVPRREVQKFFEKQNSWRISEKDVPRVGSQEGGRSSRKETSFSRGGCPRDSYTHVWRYDWGLHMFVCDIL